MGAVLVNKNRIVSIGINQIKTHPKSIARFSMLHAEIACLLGVDYDVTKGCTMYIYRETKNGDLGMSKPCEGCAMALKLAGIKKIVYTTDGSWIEERVA